MATQQAHKINKQNEPIMIIVIIINYFIILSVKFIDFFPIIVFLCTIKCAATYCDWKHTWGEYSRSLGNLYARIVIFTRKVSRYNSNKYKNAVELTCVICFKAKITIASEPDAPIY